MKWKQAERLVLLGTLALSPAMIADTAGAQISVSIGFPLPPPIVFAAPPALVVLPGSYVYVAPDLVEDVYFVDGWWWRPWQGHWYRSQSYNSGWGYHATAPSFYLNVNQGWRNNYRERRWQGHAWNYERMPEQRVASNWSSWKSTNYWNSQQNWGVPDMKDQPRNDAQPSHRQADSRAGSHPRNTEHRAARPASQKTERHASPSEHRAARPSPQKTEHKASASQHRSAPPQAQKMEHRAAKPQAQANRSQQPASNKGGQSPGHGGNAEKGQGSPEHGNGHGKR